MLRLSSWCSKRQAKPACNCRLRRDGDPGDSLANGRDLPDKNQNQKAIPGELKVSLVTHANDDSQNPRTIQWRNGQQIEKAEQQTQVRHSEANLRHAF